MPIAVTDAGIASAQNARQGGFLVNLQEFSVSEATGFEVRTDRDQPVGTQVYRGSIESIEAINSDSVRLTCSLPKGQPAVGQWNLGELCIWDSSGALFAHGSFNVFPKSDEYGLKFYVFVTLARLGEVINITTSDVYSLPSAVSVATLQAPESSTQNVVVVGDANPHDHEVSSGFPAGTSSPAIAIKHGPGGRRWGFAGHSRVFSGKPTSINSQSRFMLDPGSFGFWLADDEVLVATITEGSARGQSRKVQFNSAAKTFTVVDKAFNGLSTTSIVALWRSHEIALPRRHSGIPDYMVLGVGKNTYTSVVTTAAQTHLDPYTHSIVGNGGEAYTIPDASLPMSRIPDRDHLLLMVDGRARALSGYSITGNTLTITGGLAAGQRASIMGWARAPEDVGGILSFQDSVYESTGETGYQLSTLPQSKHGVIVADSAGWSYSNDQFNLTGSKLVFVDGQQPPIGRTLYIIQCIAATIPAVRGSLTRLSTRASAAARDIVFPRSIGDKSNTLLFVNGTYVPRARYSVAQSVITTMDVIPANADIELIVSWTEDVTSVSASGGHDSGPKWVDPAGEQGTPNRLVPVRRRHVASSGQASFAVESVLDQYHLMVFVGNKFLSPSEFLYDGTHVWPREMVTGGTVVEVICFRSMDHNGSSAHPQLTRVATTGSNSVNIHPNADLASLAVFIGNQYQPSSAYNYAQNGTLVFNSPVAAQSLVTAWSYADAEEQGKQVRMYGTTATITQTTDYLLQGTLDEVQDMVLFSGGNFLDYASFGLDNRDGFSYAKFGAPQTGLIGSMLNAVEFSSRTPRLRMVLREELNDFLRKELNLADIPDKAAARANLEIVIPPAPDLSGYVVKAANLADIPDKGAARDNLGITDQINNINQNMLIKYNNLADVPDKGAARNNLGITDIVNNLIQNMLLKGNNLADVPDKAAARANLGIPENAQVESWINPGAGQLRYKLGELVVVGGTYRHPRAVAEPVVFIPFHTWFPGGCMFVLVTTWIPSASKYFDDMTQVVGTPGANGFTIQGQSGNSSDKRWQGCNYIAFGW